MDHPPRTGKRRRSSAGSQPPRTRTGCWACRDRSVKCDESKPRCQGCAKMNLSCQYGIRLQWVEDSFARGICHGRQRQHPAWSTDLPTQRNKKRLPSQIKNRHRHTPKNPTFFVNIFNDDVLYYLQVIHPRSREYLVPGPNVSTPDNAKLDGTSEFHLPCLARPEEDEPQNHTPVTSQDVTYRSSLPPAFNLPEIMNSLDEIDGHILQYYDRIVCSSMTLLDNEKHNHYRFLIMPMIFSSSNMLNAVLAIGATKLSFTDSRFRQRALLHRQQALINQSDTLQNIGVDLTMYLVALACTLILCWCDISDFCRPSWTNHLMGLSGILNACPKEAYQNPHASMLIRTCRQYLVYHLIMARATFCSDNIIPNAKSTLSIFLGYGDATSDDVYDGIKNNPGLDLFGSSEDMNLIEPYQGFSNKLLLIINDICNLVDIRHIDKAQIAQRVSQLENKLQNLIQLPPVGIEEQTTRQNITLDEILQISGMLEPIFATAEANRLAAFLLLDEICALHFPELAPSSPRDRTEYIQKILSLVESTCNDRPVTAALPIWPVFMAACCTGEENRIRILNILDKFQCQRLFGSIPPACAVIENLWKQQDLSADENPRKPLPALSLGTLLRTSSASNKKYLKRSRLGQKRCRDFETQYPWEAAVSMLKGSILSLT